MRSEAIFETIRGDCLFIRDANNGKMSITNDAEAVVMMLHSQSLSEGRRIIYKDTDGTWGELLRDKANFIGFGEYTGWTPDDGGIENG